MRLTARAAALAAVTACLLAPTAVAQAPPTLSGETLTGNPNQVHATCEGTSSAFTIRWQVSGVATGPYPGTFQETGSHTGPGIDVVTAEFDIQSPAGRVVGTKEFVPDAPLAAAPCLGFGAGSFGTLRYEATITTAAGRFSDEGTATHAVLSPTPGSGTGTFVETFTSDLDEPVPVPGGAPTAKSQCKKGGWQAFGVFTNQGDCVAFVQTEGRNEPGQNVPGG